MIIDLRNAETDASLEADICVIGGGAAGITIARELADTGIEVLVLESGGEGFEELTQALYKGQVTGRRYHDLDVCRLRMFGGTTNHWDGSCGPLDPIDFEARPWVPYSGWPLSREDLDPYYVAAQRYCELGPYDYSAQYWKTRVAAEPFAVDPQCLTNSVAQGSPPTRFGLRYRADLDRPPNVRVILHANVVHIAASPAANRIDHVGIRVLGGEAYVARARIFVLAMGGIENARMLLASNDVYADGLGNTNDLVGRFFMDHPIAKGAFILTDRRQAYDFYTLHQIDNHSVYGYLQLSEAILRERRLTNVRMSLSPQDQYYVSEAIAALQELEKDLGDFKWPNHLAHYLWDVVSDFGMVLEGAWHSATHKHLFDDATKFAGFLVDAMMELTPNPENRVKLTEERDPLGVQRVALDWRLNMNDQENLWSCCRVLAAEIGRLGLGRVRILSDYDRTFDELLNFGCHHMGTTRAAASPKSGVVDANLKVFGLSNLYVAGSSVFPTGGHVPPTLTIVALAIRLAAHLKSLIGRQP